MNFTVIGSTGFIGSAITKKLIKENHTVLTPQKNDKTLFTSSLGHVIYAAGVTADFRSQPFNPLRSNTSLLADILEKSEFDSLLYCSSARVYRHSENTQEDTTIYLNPNDLEDLYDLTKITAEAMCHATGRTFVRIVRLTNVIGQDFKSQNFLFDIIRSACDHSHIKLRTTIDSCKDYILIDDLLNILPKIATKGRYSCYNVGSGYNISNQELLKPIISATNARLDIETDAQKIMLPPINIDRLCDEFSFIPSPILDYIPKLVCEYQKNTS